MLFLYEQLGSVVDNPLLLAFLILLSTYILEDAAILTAALLGADGLISPQLAFFSLFIGIFTGDLGLYVMGRYLNKIHWFKSFLDINAVHKAHALLDKKMISTVLLVRIVPGLRLPTYTACGFFKLSWKLFAVLVFLASLVWTAIIFYGLLSVGDMFWSGLGYWKWLLIPIFVGVMALSIKINFSEGSLHCMDVIERDRLVDSFIRPTEKNKKIHPGMPRLEKRERAISVFEFWPAFIIYTPVVLQWIWLAIRYRGLMLPLNSNPGIHLSGMVGESKEDIFSMSSGFAKEKIPRWGVISKWQSPEDGEWQARQLMEQRQLGYPLVAKPDIGCRGAGVRIIRSPWELKDYIAAFPEDGKIILQELIPHEAEAGIFYIRKPGEKKGKIFSITLKYPPYVLGNGKDTLRQLIEKDDRAGQLTSLYFKRHHQYLEQILPEGQPFRLTFAGSHSRGCIFRDGRDFITPELEASFDKVADGLSEYYYGRIDIRFRDINSLMNGENYYILEINGASSEAAHIWDSRSTLTEVYRVLFYQYRTLFQLGWLNRRRGFRPPSLKQLLNAWKHERRLVRQYPDTE